MASLLGGRWQWCKVPVTHPKLMDPTGMNVCSVTATFNLTAGAPNSTQVGRKAARLPHRGQISSNPVESDINTGNHGEQIVVAFRVHRTQPGRDALLEIAVHVMLLAPEIEAAPTATDPIIWSVTYVPITKHGGARGNEPNAGGR
jgi:hypothetical protein